MSRGGVVTNTVEKVAHKVPALKYVPVARLVIVAELILMTRDHLMLLTPGERHRLYELVRIGHGRKSRLTASERTELESLIAKLETRGLAGDAINRLSPMPLPRRITHGPKKSRQAAAARGRSNAQRQ